MVSPPHDLSAGGDALGRVTRFAQRALASHGCHPDATVSLLGVSENATFLVQDPAAGLSVLRVHRLGYHTERQIASELAWIDALRTQAGVRTPRILPAVDGRSIVTMPDPGTGQPRSCVRFEYLAGQEPPRPCPADFADLGEITARMHLHARHWARPAWFSRFHWDYDAAFGRQARWGRWQEGAGVGRAERTLLGRLSAVLHARLAAFGREDSRYGLIHADTRLANLLVDDGQVSVIDFDDCGFGWYLYDLGTSVSFFEHSPEVPGLIDAWLEGYRRAADLPAADEAEIWTFILYRRLLLVAWIGSHSAAGIARQLGAGYTRDSCDLAERYLIRHG